MDWVCLLFTREHFGWQLQRGCNRKRGIERVVPKPLIGRIEQEQGRDPWPRALCLRNCERCVITTNGVACERDVFRIDFAVQRRRCVAILSFSPSNNSEHVIAVDVLTEVDDIRGNVEP